MSTKTSASTGGQSRNASKVKRSSGLQFSMAASYVGVTVVIILVLEILGSLAITMMLTSNSFADNDIVRDAQRKAQVYALEAATLANGADLPADLTFQPGQPSSVAIPVAGSQSQDIPYITGNAIRPQQIAVLITPDAHILASSYPACYPLNASASRVLSRQLSLLQTALRGTPASSTFTIEQGRAIGAASPILSSEKRVLGAVYVQMSLDKPGGLILLYFAGEWLVTGLLLPILLAPLGAVFGIITTRKLVRRIHRLVAATASMAEGDYSQRIPVSRRDEVGQLEQQFNTMAQRLDASIAAQKALTEQNTRLEERARLARDLHDSVKQQIFAISMQLGAARSLFEHKPAAARQHLLEADNLAYEARQELTSLIQEFRPLAFNDKDFMPALREYVTTWSRQNTIAVDLDIAENCAHLPLQLANALARVVQEALSNVARHSQASHVALSLIAEQGQLTLVLEDNGRGFDPAQARGAGVGLQSMQERLAELGGTMQIQSAAGDGTQIVAHCPIAGH